MTSAFFFIVLQAIGYTMLGASLYEFWARRRDPDLTPRNVLAACAMVGCAVLVLVGGTNGYHHSLEKELELRIEAIEKTHASEERLSPLVNEIYDRIHDLQFRCDALETRAGLPPHHYGNPDFPAERP